jgi:hypothetical protein
MDSWKSSRVKITAAIVGGSAVVALGAFSTALPLEQSGPVVAKSSAMNIGSTSTETTPSAVPATSMAVPVIKGPAPLPSEQQAAE